MDKIVCSVCGEVIDGDTVEICPCCGGIVCEKDREQNTGFCKNCAEKGPYSGC